MKNKKAAVAAWIVLGVIALIAGGLLGATNALTESRIAAQVTAAAEEARLAVLSEASEFELLSEDDTVDYCYAGKDASGAVIGYVSQITVTGYGGEVEVTVGMDLTGTVTGIIVGGANFSETAGLGARSKEPAFTSQFAGIAQPVALSKDGGSVDAINGATITSRAVTSGVQAACDYMNTFIG